MDLRALSNRSANFTMDMLRTSQIATRSKKSSRRSPFSYLLTKACLAPMPFATWPCVNAFCLPSSRSRSRKIFHGQGRRVQVQDSSCREKGRTRHFGRCRHFGREREKGRSRRSAPRKNEKPGHQRLQLEADLIVRSESGLVPGRALDITESGISAILAVQLQVGATVELQIKLPMVLATTLAVVRSRNVFRHGFEFLGPLRDVVGREVASDDCQSCGGTGFILQAVAGVQEVTLTRFRCPDCGGVGRSGKPVSISLNSQLPTTAVSSETISSKSPCAPL